MKREIGSFIEEIYSYSLKLTDSRSDLTAIQKREYDKKINFELNDKGIQYSIKHFSYDDYNPSKVSYHIQFVIPETLAGGIGKLIDVKEYGAFPLLISFKHTVVSYEPRNLQKLSPSEFGEIENSEFINLKKGDDINVVGKIITCIYNKPQSYEQDQNGWLSIDVGGESVSKGIEETVKNIQRKNDEIERQKNEQAEKEGIKNGLIGVLIGGILGIVLYVVVAIFCWIFGHNSGNILYYITVSALIAGVYMYFDSYLRKKRGNGLLD